MRAHGKVALAAIVAAGVVAGGVVAGCASHGRVASVASSFLPLSTAPAPSTSAPQAPSTSAVSPSVASTSPVSTRPATVSPSAVVSSPGSPASASASQPGDNSDFTSPTPCPVPAPQKFVEGLSAKADAAGHIVFTYRTAQRLCGGPDDGQFVTTGKQDLQADVDPSAQVFLLPPDGTTQALQVPVAALPAAMAANNQAPYYALTFGSAGSIIRLEQYFHP